MSVLCHFRAEGSFLPRPSTISPRKPQWVIHAESLPLGRGADGKRPQSPSLDLALPSPCAGIGIGDWLPLGLGAACSGPAVVWCGPAHDGGQGREAASFPSPRAAECLLCATVALALVCGSCLLGKAWACLFTSILVLLGCSVSPSEGGGLGFCCGGGRERAVSPGKLAAPRTPLCGSSRVLSTCRAGSGLASDCTAV